MNPGGSGKLRRAMAAVCMSCPMCRRARSRPGGVAAQIVQKVEVRICPFCRAYEAVYGRKASANKK